MNYLFSRCDIIWKKKSAVIAVVGETKQDLCYAFVCVYVICNRWCILRRLTRDAGAFVWISCVSTYDVDKCTCILEIGITFSPFGSSHGGHCASLISHKCIICTHIKYKLESGRRARAREEGERSRVKVDFEAHPRTPDASSRVDPYAISPSTSTNSFKRAAILKS